MPVNSKFSVLGLDVEVPTPTIEEWQTKWGADSLRTEATANVWYRSTAADLRDMFLHGTEEQKDDKGNVIRPARKGLDDITGIPRLVKTLNLKKKDGTAYTREVWDPEDSEQKYFNRVVAEVAKKQFSNLPEDQALEAARKSFLPLMAECIALCPFDASKAPPAERKAKGIPAAFLAAAKNAVEKGTADKLAKLLRKALGHDVATDVESLAKAMQEDDVRLREQRQKELAALVG